MFTLLFGGSSKVVPKKYAPHGERLGLHVWQLYITFAAKINALRHCKTDFSAPNGQIPHIG